MKSVMFGVVALFAVGCAGSQPAVAYRSAEAPARPAPQPAVAAVSKVVSAQPIAHAPSSAPPPTPVAPPAAGAPLGAGPEADDCAHILKHLGEESQLLAARTADGSSQSLVRATKAYLEAVAVVDPQHPKLHHGLKVRVATMSTWATRVGSLMLEPTVDEDEVKKDVGSFQSSVDAIGEYCAPFVVVQGEKS